MPDLGEYQRSVERDLLPELSLGRRFGDLLALAPTACLAMLKHTPGLWQGFCDVVRGDKTFREVRRKLGPLAYGVDLISGVAGMMPRWRQ